MSSRKQLQEDETFVHCPLYNYKGVIYLKGRIEAGCSQEEGPKKGFVIGSRTQGVPLFATNFLSRVLCNWVHKSPSVSMQETQILFSPPGLGRRELPFLYP